MVTKNFHIPSTLRAENFEKTETEMFLEEMELAYDPREFWHPIIEPPKKKLEFSETSLTSATEQNINV